MIQLGIWRGSKIVTGVVDLRLCVHLAACVGKLLVIFYPAERKGEWRLSINCQTA
jgi:hypothetical protein